MKIYIAGRITGWPNYKEDFRKAEEELIKRGHAVINPAKNLGFSYKDYIDMGLMELSKCDAIYLIPGWSYSRGARLEHHYAIIVGLKKFMSIDSVPFEDANASREKIKNE